MKFRVYKKHQGKYVDDVLINKNGSMFIIHEDWIELVTERNYSLEFATELLDSEEKEIYEMDKIFIKSAKYPDGIVGVVEFSCGEFDVFLYENELPTIFAGGLVEILEENEVTIIGRHN